MSFISNKNDFSSCKTSNEGEAWVEVKALREGAPFLGRHLPLVAYGKVFKVIHHLRLQKKTKQKS